MLLAQIMAMKINVLMKIPEIDGNISDINNVDSEDQKIKIK